MDGSGSGSIIRKLDLYVCAYNENMREELFSVAGLEPRNMGLHYIRNGKIYSRQTQESGVKVLSSTHPPNKQLDKGKVLFIQFSNRDYYCTHTYMHTRSLGLFIDFFSLFIRFRSHFNFSEVSSQ
jgi:hypothetical protein